MSQQNPTIPTATQAKGVDAVVVDLQTVLSFDLSWLTNGMGRAYKLQKRIGKAARFLPLVYLGTNQSDYFNAIADNQKEGQSIILVGDGTLVDSRTGRYGLMEYPISFIFSANLKIIDETLLLTEDFTEHLMEDVRESLIRNLLGKSYKLELTEETRQYEDVYSEFDVAPDTTNEQLLPMTYFRFDGTLMFEEDCGGATLNRCAAITQNLTEEDKNECILPAYDFSNTTVQSNVTAGQQVDLIDWLCGTPVVCYTSFKGLDEYINIGNDSSIDFEKTDAFSISAWIEVSSYSTGIIVAKYLSAGAASKGWYFSIDAAGKITFSIQVSGGSNGFSVSTLSTIIALNVRTLVVVSYNGINASGVTITVGGAVRSTVINFNTLGAGSIKSTVDARIGAFETGFFFQGYMNNVAIFNAAISLSDITTINNLTWLNSSPYTTLGVVSHYFLNSLNPTDEVGTNNGTSFNMDSSNIICT